MRSQGIIQIVAAAAVILAIWLVTDLLNVGPALFQGLVALHGGR